MLTVHYSRVPIVVNQQLSTGGTSAISLMHEEFPKVARKGQHMRPSKQKQRPGVPNTASQTSGSA